MKTFLAIPIAAIVSASAPAPAAHAQTTFVTKPYLRFSDTIHTDVVIREKRIGTKVESAELDLCLGDYTDYKWDRVVIPLKAEGEDFTGSGVSEIEKVPVAFRYSRRPKGKNLNFIGALTVGKETVLFESERVLESTEKEYSESIYTIPLVENPSDFTNVSPQWLTLKVKLGKMPAVLEALRKENVVLDSQNGLVEDCSVLRSREQLIQFEIQPERAPAAVERLRKTDGVIAAGWGGASWIAYGVRLPAAAWVSGGKPDRAKLEKELAKSIAAAVQAEVVSTSWDQIRGDLVLKLKRNSIKFRKLGLTEQIEIRVLAEHERLGNSGDIVVWVLNAAAALADEGPGSRVKVQPVSEIGGEGIYFDQQAIAKQIAADLKGKTWNPETEKWNP